MNNKQKISLLLAQTCLSFFAVSCEKSNWLPEEKQTLKGGTKHKYTVYAYYGTSSILLNSNSYSLVANFYAGRQNHEIYKMAFIPLNQ